MIRIIILAAIIALVAIAYMALIPVGITGADNGRTIEVLRFRTIRLTLESNPTTGYTWELLSPNDRSVLREYYSVYRRPASRLAGAGGVQELKFRAIGAGLAKVELVYRRPWESPDLPSPSVSGKISEAGLRRCGIINKQIRSFALTGSGSKISMVCAKKFWRGCLVA